MTIFVGADCETTGLDPSDEVTEVAVAAYDDEAKRLVFAASYIVAGHKTIPPKLAEMTGITDELRARVGVPYRIAAHDISTGLVSALEKPEPPSHGQMLGLHPRPEVVLVGHYLPFDYAMLRGMPWFSWDAKVCTKVLSHLDPLREEGGSTSLGPTCARHGISLEGAHTALADAMATARLAPRLLRSLGIVLDFSRESVVGPSEITMPFYFQQKGMSLVGGRGGAEWR